MTSRHVLLMHMTDSRSDLSSWSAREGNNCVICNCCLYCCATGTALSLSAGNQSLREVPHLLAFEGSNPKQVSVFPSRAFSQFGWLVHGSGNDEHKPLPTSKCCFSANKTHEEMTSCEAWRLVARWPSVS
jgi:hypothetical protein